MLQRLFKGAGRIIVGGLIAALMLIVAFMVCIPLYRFDPVRTTSQSVRLRIANAISGAPVEGAQVLLKYDFETAESQYAATNPEQYHVKLQRWKQATWTSGLTDQHGDVTIEIRSTAVDRTRGSLPPSERDEFTGRPYLIAVKEGASPQVQIKVVMLPAEVAISESNTVTVVKIEAPRYISTPK